MPAWWCWRRRRSPTRRRIPFAWETRTAFGLLLAALWTGLGLHDRRRAAFSRNVFVAGALSNVVLALVWMLGCRGRCCWAGGADSTAGAGGRVAVVAGFGIASASARLRCSGLHWGIAVLIKRGYFPVRVPAGLFAGVLALWSLLWWLAWRFPLDGEALAGRRAIEQDGLPGHRKDVGRGSPAWVRAPLEQTMALLWVVGLAYLSLRLLDGMMAAKWVVRQAWRH